MFLKNILGLALLLPVICLSQTNLSNEYWKLQTDNQGRFTQLSNSTYNSWQEVPLQKDTFCGPAFYYSLNNRTQEQVIQPLKLQAMGYNAYQGKLNDIELSLQYSLEQDQLVITAKLMNKGKKSFAPQKLGLIMGISNYMTGYPQWNQVYFPTMLRCEKTHFTGYLMTPAGQIMVLASPDAIASYSLNYNYGYGAGNDYFFGHRIYTFNLDLINTLPLPERHPQDLNTIAAGASKTWRIYCKNVNSLEEVAPTISVLAHAATFEINHTTVEPNNRENILINGSLKKLSMVQPDGSRVSLPFTQLKTNRYSFYFKPGKATGLYAFYAVTVGNKISEAKSQGSIFKIYPESQL